jgi:hypothetical protein
MMAPTQRRRPVPSRLAVFRIGQRGVVSLTTASPDSDPEPLQNPSEIVRLPAMPEYQLDGDCLRELADPQVIGRVSHQLVELLIHIAFIDHRVY